MSTKNQIDSQENQEDRITVHIKIIDKETGETITTSTIQLDATKTITIEITKETKTKKQETKNEKQGQRIPRLTPKEQAILEILEKLGADTPEKALTVERILEEYMKSNMKPAKKEQYDKPSGRIISRILGRLQNLELITKTTKEGKKAYYLKREGKKAESRHRQYKNIPPQPL